MVVVLFVQVLLVSVLLSGCLSLSPVLVSEPVLSVVGDTLVLGKSFQVLCASDHGSLPITYTLWRPGMRFGEPKTMSTREEQAIFNCSAIFDKSLLKNFICHAKNSQNRPPTVADGSQLLHSTTIIGEMQK